MTQTKHNLDDLDIPKSEPQPPPRVDVLQEAARLIDGDRNKSYGTPTQNFANIAALWTVQFGHMLKPGERFTGRHVAEALIHLKLARNIADPKRDNWVDLAGYAGCGYETTVEEAAAEPTPASALARQVADQITFNMRTV